MTEHNCIVFLLKLKKNTELNVMQYTTTLVTKE